MSPERLLRLALLGLSLVVSASCDSSSLNSWRTDMWYQPSIRPEDAPRAQPETSVPLGAGAFYFDRDDTVALKNPVASTPASLLRGQVTFTHRCLPCHGQAGHGDGPVSKKGFPPATDLAYKTVVERSDGYLFGTITFGGRAMPSQREGLTEADRWDVVNFVRSLQRAGAVVPP